MSLINALALLLGGIGTVLAYLSLGPAAGVYLIWSVFIFTATGVGLGGDRAAFRKLVVCGLAGVAIAWVAAVVIVSVPLAATLTLPVWAGLVVGLSTACLALIAHVPVFATIPATVIGYASTFAYLVQTPGKLSLAVLLGATADNPLFVMPASLLVAWGFGTVTLALAGRLTAKPVAA